MQIYLVGGAVRDELLGLPIRERDWVVVGGSETQMLAQGFEKVGKDFPVFLHPVTHEEYALARTERKTGKGYYGFKCDSSMNVTLEEDLLRRDLTINAMAKTTSGEIIDPFNGKLDLQQRVLRHVSPAFVEDPVRILRLARFAARFAQFGFTIADTTKELMHTMVMENEVDHLVPERVWQEMLRALTEVKPAVFFQVLRECGALQRIFPALDALWGVPQPAKCHPEIDTGIHTMLALDAACALTTDPKIRFAVLCHDVGKALTPKAQLPNHEGHQELGIAIIKEWCEKYRIPNDYKEFAIHFSRWRMYSHNAVKTAAEDIMQMFNAMRVFHNNKILDAFLIAAESDHKGRLGFADSPYPQADFLRQAFSVAQCIYARQLENQGFSGPALGQALTSERIKAVAEFCRSQQPAA